MDKNKVKTFMYMLLKEASRYSLVELCEEYDISEDEMNEIIKYIEEKLEIEIY